MNDKNKARLTDIESDIKEYEERRDNLLEQVADMERRLIGERGQRRDILLAEVELSYGDGLRMTRESRDNYTGNPFCLYPNAVCFVHDIAPDGYITIIEGKGIEEHDFLPGVVIRMKEAYDKESVL